MAGHAGRSGYYKQRVGGFYGDQIQCLARCIANRLPVDAVSRKDIISSLTKEYGASEAEQLFQRFVQKGVLGEQGAGYAVPIPSMHTWLEKEYGRDQIKAPEETQTIRESGSGSSGMGFEL